MGRRDYSGSLMVMVTYDCQFRCVYCGVRRAARAMPWETLRSAIELLLQTRQPSLQLRYFGGEPLLRFDLIRRAIAYTERRRASAGKSVRHMITTNGLLLDRKKLAWLSGRDVEIMFSCDGSAQAHRRLRPLAGGRDVHDRLRANLASLRDSGARFFVNFVVDPDGLEAAREGLALLASWGVGRVQIGYRVGVAWGRRQRAAYLALLTEAIRLSRARGMDVLNLHNESEPVMLSDELLVDTDGGIYLDAAVFVERSFPALRRALCVGRLGEAEDLGRLQRTRSEILRLFRGCYPPATARGRLLLNNLALGLDVARLISGLQREKAGTPA